MSGLLVKIGKGIEERLTSAVFAAAQTFVVTRNYSPNYEKRELIFPTLTVIPRAALHQLDSRTTDKETIEFVIGVQQNCKPEETTKIDGLLDLTEEVRLWLNRWYPTTSPQVTWIGQANDPIYDPVLLREKSVFVSVLVISFKVIRPA